MRTAIGRGHQFLFLVCMASVVWGATPTVAADIFAVQARFSPLNFQLFHGLNDDSSIASSGPLFGPAGGVYAMSFLGETLYAVELANGSSDEYLATIPHDGGLIGQGSRVGTSPIGFASIEGLAAAEGILYATSIDFPAHRTTLLTVNSTTGIGTSIGVGSFDVILVGLAFDPVQSILYGAGIPFGATGVNTPNLYTVNRATGATSLVGDMGTAIQSLSWDSQLGLIGAFDRLYQINTTTGAASAVGATDFTQGVAGAGNGIYSLAALASSTAVIGDYNGDGTVNAADYSVWRDHLGMSIALLNEDPSVTPGMVTQADYDVWRERFGATIGALADSSASIPEPSTLVIAALSLLLISVMRMPRLPRPAVQA